ncbi:MAG: diiron oxygenase [Deltaproteobacteria bacterium]|nr:diiron oxygenase [Deltaproteobacteria bacterium]
MPRTGPKREDELMRHWRRHATLHTTPRRVLEPVEGAATLYYSRDLTPIAAHPLIETLGPAAGHALLVQELYAHLEFTAHLEHRVVTQVAWELGIGRMLPWQQVGHRLDANKIYVDEAYHSMVAVDFGQQVHAHSLVAPCVPAEPVFLDRLRTICDRAPAALVPDIRLLFVVISETLITETLRQIYTDAEVLPCVRAVIRDHAKDEAVHRAYFSRLFTRWWPRLPVAEQQRLGAYIPQLIECYFAIDVPTSRARLLEVGLDGCQAQAVIEESLSEHAHRERLATATEGTLRLFRELGVFEHAQIHDAFERRGLTH